MVVTVCLFSRCRPAFVSTGFLQPSPQSLDEHRDFSWIRDTTNHFLIRIDTSRTGAIARDSIAGGLEAALSHVVQMLELPDNSPQLHAFAVGSSGHVRTLLGREVDGRAFFNTRVFAFAVDADWHATARHELTHVLLRNVWPGEPAQWLSEGVATYVGDHFYGRDVHRLVRERLITTGRMLPLRTLMDSFSRYPDEVTYLQSASVVKFLHTRFGMSVMREAWRGGTDGLLCATGLDVENIERQWRQTVERME